MEASITVGPPPRGPAAQDRLLRLGTDDQLVDLYRRGFEEAFDTIDQRYRAQMFAYTRQMLGYSNADAEDAVQEVLIRASRSLKNDDRQVVLRPWLYRIAHNYCIDVIRRPAVPLCELYDVSRSPTRDPALVVEQREDVRRLVTDMERLPFEQRSALLMQIDGLHNPEIGMALGISAHAVKSALNRARANLKIANEARETACVDIRAELDRARGRKVRMTGRARRHLKDCAGCRAYKAEMRVRSRALNPLAADPGIFGGIAKLLGIGGAGSGAVAGGGAAAGGGVAATISVGAGTMAAKITTLVCCVAIGGAGVGAAGRDRTREQQNAHPAGVVQREGTTDRHHGSTSAHADPSGRVQAAPTVVAATRPTRRARSVGHMRPAPVSPSASVPSTLDRNAPVTTHWAPTAGTSRTDYTSTADAAHQTGGAAAPDEDPATTADPATRDASTPNIAPADADTTAAPNQSAPAGPDSNPTPQPAADPPIAPVQTTTPAATGGTSAAASAPATTPAPAAPTAVNEVTQPTTAAP